MEKKTNKTMMPKVTEKYMEKMYADMIAKTDFRAVSNAPNMLYLGHKGYEEEYVYFTPSTALETVRRMMDALMGDIQKDPQDRCSTQRYILELVYDPVNDGTGVEMYPSLQLNMILASACDYGNLS